MIAQKYQITVKVPESNPNRTEGITLKEQLEKSGKALHERGDKLTQLNDRAQKLEDEAANFASSARQLVSKYEN
jgi:Synaptobrevin